MEEQAKSGVSIQYMKPEAIDLGAAVLVQGGTTCVSNGISATTGCTEGISAGSTSPGCSGGSLATARCATGGSGAT